MKLTKRAARMVALRYAVGVLKSDADFEMLPIYGEEEGDYDHNDDLVHTELRAVAASLKARLERFKEKDDAD